MQKAFTLIELLVVISMISLLSSFVLASLNSARNSGKDAAIKQQLLQMRSAAEMIKNVNFNYNAVCDVNSSAQKLFESAYRNNPGGSNSVCVDTDTTMWFGNNPSGGGPGTAAAIGADGWAASIQLNKGGWFCIDYTGFSGEQSSRGISWSPRDMECR